MVVYIPFNFYITNSYSGLWSDSDLQEHPLQQVSEKTFIAREDDSVSNRGLSLSRLFNIAICLLYYIPWQIWKKFDLGKIWIFLSCVWYIYIKNKYKKNSEHTILVPHYLNLDLNHTHLQGSILVVSLSNIISPVSPHDSHVCAYIADVI